MGSASIRGGAGRFRVSSRFCSKQRSKGRMAKMMHYCTSVERHVAGLSVGYLMV